MTKAPASPRATHMAPKAASPPTPEVTRKIEESRLRAKALRERSLAAEAAASSISSGNPPQSIKRTHSSFATDTKNLPSTSRDGRLPPSAPPADGDIEPARKFRKFVDHDFSKMTDTKGGFLNVEDDPWNKTMFAPEEKGNGKPEHMSLKEWERMQLLRNLRRKKEGLFEPGLSVLDEKGKVMKKCKECDSMEIDWVWEEVFTVAVCHRCKDKLPERYSLLTKTECKDDYLLTDPELKDVELLPHLNKPNPHKSHWHDMMLFLRFQVEEYAFKKWGSAEALDAEFERRETDKRKRKEDKFKSKLNELKKKTRAEAYRRGLRGEGGGGNFGDAIGKGKHKHDWGQTVENAEGITVKTCLGCGMEVEELEF